MMCKKLFIVAILGSFFFLISSASAVVSLESAGWTAYNDCVYDSSLESLISPTGQPMNYIAPNVTIFGIGSGFSGSSSGELLDQATGNPHRSHSDAHSKRWCDLADQARPKIGMVDMMLPQAPTPTIPRWNSRHDRSYLLRQRYWLVCRSDFNGSGS